MNQVLLAEGDALGRLRKEGALATSPKSHDEEAPKRRLTRLIRTPSRECGKGAAPAFSVLGEGYDLGRPHTPRSLSPESNSRFREALALEVADIDLGRGTISVRRAKGDRPRIAYVPAELGAQLAAWVEGREGRLFAISGRHAQRRIGEIANAAGIPGASAHALRHSLAMRVYRKTGDIEVVRAALGHASIQTTTRYARAEEGAVRRAVGA